MNIKRFFNCAVPVYSCNLKCSYCFVGQKDLSNRKDLNATLSPELIKQAFTTERTRGRALINLCGMGETLIPAEMIDIIRGLLENGQFVSVVTNCTLTNKIMQLCEMEKQYKDRLFIKCSFHYEELIRTNLLDVFFDNVQWLRENKISYTIEMVANDSLISKEKQIKDIFQSKNEAMPHILESRYIADDSFRRLTNLKAEDHQQAWEKYDSELFRAQQSLWGEKRSEFCMAGGLSVDVDLKSGCMAQCNTGGKQIGNIYENLDDPMEFCAIGSNCPTPHCFISYVWQGLCGNIENIPYATYDEMRNRKRPDGQEWLTPVIKGAFSKRCSDYLTYSEQKKQVVNGIMSLYYDNSVPEEAYMALKEWMDEKLSNEGIRSVVLYGFGRIGKALKEVFDSIDIKVVKIVDRSVKESVGLYETTDIFWSHVADLHSKADAVIVTPISDGQGIKEKITDKNPYLKVINILEEIQYIV